MLHSSKLTSMGLDRWQPCWKSIDQLILQLTCKSLAHIWTSNTMLCQSEPKSALKNKALTRAVFKENIQRPDKTKCNDQFVVSRK